MTAEGLTLEETFYIYAALAAGMGAIVGSVVTLAVMMASPAFVRRSLGESKFHSLIGQHVGALVQEVAAGRRECHLVAQRTRQQVLEVEVGLDTVRDKAVSLLACVDKDELAVAKKRLHRKQILARLGRK